MRRLNLAEKCGVRLERTDPRPLHEITFGGERVFLDPGTLSCFAAESDAERPPITPTATSFNKDSQDVQDSERQASCVSCPSLLNDVAVAVSERLRAPWLDNRWYSRRACRECWARNVCGGGCRAEALSHVGSVAEVWPVACAVKKAQVSAALYVAAACSREKLGAQLGARARQPRRRDIVAAGV